MAFKKDDQILYQNDHWTVVRAAYATDGVKILQLGKLEPSPLFWIRVQEEGKHIIDGFYKENESFTKDRVFPEHFLLNGSAYDFKLKTRMNCAAEANGLFHNDTSIDISIYEDKIKKTFLVQIKGGNTDYLFEGDNYASEEMMILSAD